MKPDPEQTLRTLRWRDPPTEFLARVLDDAQRERAHLASRKSWLAFSFYFWLTTPKPNA
jgi:hypothetical protein